MECGNVVRPNRILRVGSSRNDRASLKPKGQVSGLAPERTYGLRRGLDLNPKP